MSVLVDFSTITEMFDQITRKFSDRSRPVLSHKVNGSYRGVSYSDLRLRVQNFALGLASLGVKRDDHLGLISENRPEWVVADMGMLSIGAVNIPMYPTLTPKQIEYILLDARVSFVVVSNQFQLNKILKILPSVPSIRKIIVMTENGIPEDDRVVWFSTVLKMGEEFGKKHQGLLEAELKKTSPDDLLTIIYTSGTTGNPKGVMLTHRNLASNIKASATCIPFTSNDVVLSFLPLCHSYERMAGYYTALACGVLIAYAESIDTVRENLVEVKPTIVTTVPRLFERIHNRILKQINNGPPIRQKIFHWAIEVGRKYAVARKRGSVSLVLAVQHAIAEKLVYQKIKQSVGGRMQFFVSGGAALPRELGEFFEALGILILEGYGLSETSPVISVNRVDDYKFGSVGKPIPGVEVKIAEDGEILVRGPSIMKGYWNNAKETEEVLDKQGWFRTGDIGQFDTEGFLHITDRKKHLFVSSGGKNIAPQPIENLFQQSGYIDQFVLIGEKRMFCSALIVPDFDALKEFAKKHNIVYSSNEDLLNNESIVNLMEEEIDSLQKDLANFERVRKFTLLPKPLTIEEGEMTPTLKVRRKIVEEKFKHLIERMYEGKT